MQKIVKEGAIILGNKYFQINISLLRKFNKIFKLIFRSAACKAMRNQSTREFIPCRLQRGKVAVPRQSSGSASNARLGIAPL